ncbi:uncharacterized protein BO96DRAFT_462717 [Aspergillus niger CBS 101883]|uniref:Uncharacterized protein n=2 Tax=Aspergillus niger TaxID=5061 RepID=A2R7D7_ASPNC|nr:uncharacterized protein BO96DRAFT_462717 [Aspergillus niger CBS 101883]XP_059602722.1 hypothetical protein An16g03170 [Aspergillus niger]PYH61625.1 hypothetical protein BO96DRAFT_462717 [Aspergillus niger CBS 101883]CAK42815.1 hypothetical protein An16g03170 [Aspergillus niger]
MGDTNSCLQGWRIPTYQMSIPQQACCTLIELPVRIMTTEGYHDSRGGPPYAVWLLRESPKYYRITLGRYHSIRTCVWIWTPTRSPIMHLAVPPESDPFGPKLTTFSPLYARLPLPFCRYLGFVTGFSDDNSHCGDSYSYRGEHLIPQREFLSPLISSFFVAAVKPVLLQVEDGCKIGPILVGHAFLSMRLNTYPGLKQGSTELTTENLSAGPNIKSFSVKKLDNSYPGSSALGAKVKPSQKQNKGTPTGKEKNEELKKASLGSVICKSIGHVRPEHS